MNGMPGAVQHALHAEGLWSRVDPAVDPADQMEDEEVVEEEAGIGRGWGNQRFGRESIGRCACKKWGKSSVKELWLETIQYFPNG